MSRPRTLMSKAAGSVNAATCPLKRPVCPLSRAMRICMSTTTEVAAPSTPSRRSVAVTPGRPRLRQTFSLNTVRSAAQSVRNNACTHEPSPPRTSPHTAGRTMPSSHRRHDPSVRINARPPFPGNNAREQPRVFRMSCLCSCQNLVGGIAHKQLLTRDGNNFPPVAVHVRGMLLQPGPVALELLPARPRAAYLKRIAFLFHKYGEDVGHEIL